MARPKKQDSSTASEAAPTPTPNAGAEAFARVEPELASVPAEQLPAADVDIAVAIQAAMAAVPRILEHRAAIQEQLPKHPAAALDHVELYAQATRYAHLVHAYAAGPESAKALLDEGTRLREGLLVAAEALAHRNLLDADEVARLRKSNDLGNDLVALAGVFGESWGKVSSKTAVERHEVERAREIGPAILVASTAAKHAGKSVDTADQRARAFALLLGAYDSCRQALTYVRWKEGDADTIAPSLLKKKAGRKPGKKNEEAEAEQAPEASAEPTAG